MNNIILEIKQKKNKKQNNNLIQKLLNNLNLMELMLLLIFLIVILIVKIAFSMVVFLLHLSIIYNLILNYLKKKDHNLLQENQIIEKL